MRAACPRRLGRERTARGRPRTPGGCQLPGVRAGRWRLPQVARAGPEGGLEGPGEAAEVPEAPAECDSGDRQIRQPRVEQVTPASVEPASPDVRRYRLVL